MGRWTGTAVRPKWDCTLFERALEAGALAIELIDDDGAGQLELVGKAPHLLGLDFHAGHAVHQDQGGIGGHQRRPGVVDERY